MIQRYRNVIYYQTDLWKWIFYSYTKYVQLVRNMWNTEVDQNALWGTKVFMPQMEP